MHENDNDLLRLIKQSPSEGLEMAIYLYGGAVKTICINVMGNNKSEDIEECVSDVFAELWSSYEKFQVEKGSLKSYIYGIARHKAVDYCRKGGTKALTISLEDAEISIHANFDDEIARKINSKILQETIDALPSPDREIFVYRYYFYEKVKDIADRLSLSPKAVENKLYRGKTALKEQLLERGIVL